MDGTAGEASCSGLILDGKFKLEKLLRHDGHATVYSVSAIPPQTTSLEARAYSLQALPQKVRQYRLRNVKRLASRTVLETRWQGMVLIVYKAGGWQGNKDLGKSVLVETLPCETKPTPAPVNKKPHQKSGRQREKARIRQFERRKSSRQKERHLKVVECPAETSENEVDVRKEVDQKEPTPAPLHHTESDQPPTRKELAARCRRALENIFEQDLKLEGDDEEEDVLEKHLVRLSLNTRKFKENIDRQKRDSKRLQTRRVERERRQEDVPIYERYSHLL